jgi:hypothetical protein
MKTLAALLALACIASAQLPPSAVTQKPKPPPVKKVEPKAKPQPSAVRFYKLTIKQVLPGKGVLASGSFHDLDPILDLQPYQLPYGMQRTCFTGDIFVKCSTDGLIDGAAVSTWAAPDGTLSFTTVLGAVRTVAAFRIVDDPTGGSR